jgi:hypothetical protein
MDLRVESAILINEIAVKIAAAWPQEIMTKRPDDMPNGM